MTRLRLAVALLAAALLAPSFGDKGGGVGKVLVYGDSFVDERELRDEIAASLGIDVSRVYSLLGQGGARIDRFSFVADEDQCTSTNGWAPEDCRQVLEQLGRLGADGEYDAAGTCRSFADTEGLTTVDASMCTAADTPLDCCTGSGTGTCAPTCLHEIQFAAGDYVVIQESANTVRENSPSADCDTARMTEFKADYQVMFDIADDVGVRVVWSMDPTTIEDPWYGDSTLTDEQAACMGEWAETTLQAANPDHLILNNVGGWNDYQAAFGDEALAGLYVDCPLPLPCANAEDGTHPGATENTRGDTGQALLGYRIGWAIRELEARRKGR